MAATVQFVDQISASPTVRIDLNTQASGLMVDMDGLDLSPPPLRRAVVSTLLADGEDIPAAAYSNRVLKIPVKLLAATSDTGAGVLQSLARELARPTNILKLQVHAATSPVFFRTYTAPDYTLSMLRLLLTTGTTVGLEIPAEPFALGLKETIPAVTVYDDPTEGATLNTNPFFETNATNWAVTGGTFVRSTAQFHEGAASGLLTPSGSVNSVFVEAEEVAVSNGQLVRGSGWMRCATARTVQLRIDWYDTGHAFNNQSTLQSTAVSANTWTYFDGTANAPVAGYARLTPLMSGTPVPSADLLYVDEARIRFPGASGGMCFDLTGIKGDVETPLVLTLPAGNLYDSGDPITVVALRRRGTVGNAPFAVQAEAMSLDTDTTLPGNDAVMSGTGSNYARVSFATNTFMTRRVHLDTFPTSPSVDNRGRYRVFALLRKTVASGTVNAQLGYTSSTPPALVQNDRVTADAVTGRCHLDLGLISFPTGLDPVYDGYSGTELPVKGRYVEIRAERVSGTASLDIDYILFVPADDQLALIDWGDALSTTDEFVIDGTHEMVYAQTTSDEVYGAKPAVLAGGFPMVSPGVTNRIYWVRRVGRGATVTKTETTSIVAAYWPRYLFVRPATT